MILWLYRDTSQSAGTTFLCISFILFFAHISAKTKPFELKFSEIVFRDYQIKPSYNSPAQLELYTWSHS